MMIASLLRTYRLNRLINDKSMG
ncbi:hypothetical protein WH7805_13193 [Synechococcus sp. WH 7805]|nr:hypothetical protein WH7805_13193 [Synechococcus sp. WH 7805]